MNAPRGPGRVPKLLIFVTDLALSCSFELLKCEEEGNCTTGTCLVPHLSAQRDVKDLFSVSLLEEQSVRIPCQSDKCGIVKSKCSQSSF